MDKSSINNYFHSLFSIKDEVVEKITETFSHFELKANAVLLDQNTISTKTYFLEKGYVRSYLLNEDNEEITTNIYAAPCFVNDFYPFSDSSLPKKSIRPLQTVHSGKPDWKTYSIISIIFQNSGSSAGFFLS